MSWYNHFSEYKYKLLDLKFCELPIGDSFRMDLFDLKTNRRRREILMIKTGELEYMETKSKRIHTVSRGYFEINHHSQKNVKR